ncbi:response regulator [Hydrogenimonas sp. SS33]|uniref:response regulator n=1 Tax=Hydrogenimonas leucolamina TaxID=2954236 RepID=UPI00336BF899
MEGKIVVYSDETGLGKIITPEHKKYNFSIDEWNEYESMPAVGVVVSFEPEGINALNVTLKTVSPKAAEAPKKAKRQEEVPASIREPSQEPPAAAIASSMEVEECIQSHFAPILKKIAENSDLIRENRRLDFLRMRRFLNTAYNNLIEIDHSFENYELAEIRQQLDEAYGTYRDFRSRTAYLSNAYERVFLSKQIRYKELRAKLDLNKAQIAKLNESAKNREEEVKEKSKRLATLSPQSEEYIYLFNEIKILKRAMVDAIHEVAKLTDENRLYIDMLDNFYKTHYERFKSAFNEFVQAHESLLRRIQDVLAYRFDAMMWKKANRSKPIQNFFAKAGITDEFSAVTYLKYYLKTLDASKLNEQNQELVDLLNYLEQQTKKRVVCIDDDTEFLMLVKQVLGEIDREIKVTLSSRPEAVLPDLKNIRPNVILLDPTMRHVDAESVAGYARKTVPDVEIAFFAKRINRELLLLAKQVNAAAIIPKTHNRTELAEQLRQYIE